MTVSSHVYMCLPCRKVAKGHHLLCPSCGLPMTDMGYRWRPPKKTNEAAWKRIAAGDFMWERPLHPVSWTKDWVWQLRRSNPKEHRSALRKEE